MVTKYQKGNFTAKFSQVSNFFINQLIWLKRKCNLKHTSAPLCLPSNININQLVPFMRVLGNLGLYSLQLGSLMDPLHKLVAHCSNNPHAQCVPILSEVAFIYNNKCSAMYINFWNILMVTLLNMNLISWGTNIQPKLNKLYKNLCIYICNKVNKEKLKVI